MNIAIVNYGLGNLGSVKNMLKKVGCSNTEITNDANLIKAADKIILPGVGSFDHGMTQLQGLLNVLNEEVLIKKKPILGICLGAQLMCKYSEEGSSDGLGWFNASVNKFRFEDKKLKVPHMGWNEVHPSKKHLILNNLENPARFYFVHSYYMDTTEQQDVLLSCNYGKSFVAALQKDNIIATQFHPEKSHKFGMQIFSNFVNL